MEVEGITVSLLCGQLGVGPGQRGQCRKLSPEDRKSQGSPTPGGDDGQDGANTELRRASHQRLAFNSSFT